MAIALWIQKIYRIEKILEWTHTTHRHQKFFTDSVNTYYIASVLLDNHTENEKGAGLCLFGRTREMLSIHSPDAGWTIGPGQTEVD